MRDHLRQIQTHATVRDPEGSGHVGPAGARFEAAAALRAGLDIPDRRS